MANKESPAISRDAQKVSYDEIEFAARSIEPFILRTPCVPAHCSRQFGMNVHYKLENMQPSGSFEERGIVYAFQKIPCGKRQNGIVMASLGNSGYAAALLCNQYNFPLIVVVPNSVPISRMQRIFELNSDVVIHGATIADSQRYARALAKDRGIVYLNSCDHPDLITGYGSVALEIIEDVPEVDAVIVPVGSGGLVAAVATVIKQLKPECLVYGVSSDSTPYFHEYMKTGGPPEKVDNEPTIADGINVNVVGDISLDNAKGLLDRMILVPEDDIALAVTHMYDRERLVVEGAGACPLAAILGKHVPELAKKTVVALISGGNIDASVYSRIIQRGMGADGMLVQVRVEIKDNAEAQAELLQLVRSADYNLIHQFQTHRWTEGAEYFMEMTLCMRCRNMLHAYELKKLLEQKYPGRVQFENEPIKPPTPPASNTDCPCCLKGHGSL